jgi:glycosyltransferase involved in cell wall biosynthesis
MSSPLVPGPRSRPSAPGSIPRVAGVQTPAEDPDLVVAASYGRAGASMRVRVLQWLDHLGLQADVHDYMGLANARPSTILRRPVAALAAEVALRRLRRAPAPERLLISRAAGPFTGGRLERTLLQRAGWGVYDFDDALYADDRAGIHRFFGEGAGWEDCVRAADVVVAGNDLLAEAAARFTGSVEVIPSCVEPDDYPVKQAYAVRAAPQLVWLGSPSTERYLDPIAPALLQLHRAIGARLTVISGGDRSLGELDAMVDRVAWAGARTDALLAEADLGLMPLPDTPFSRGKCAYKLLQYGAAGLPAVASPVGVNARVIGQTQALAASTVDDWIDAVSALLAESESARRERGRAARQAVIEHYSYAAWAPAFRRVLRLGDTGRTLPGQEPTGRSPR